MTIRQAGQKGWNVDRQRVQVWLLSVLLLTGCDLPGRPESTNRSRTPEEMVEFEGLYAKHCAGCHGADGHLGPAPPLNAPLFLAIAADETLQEVIEKGRPGTPMPAFGKSYGGALTDGQIQALVKGMKSRWKAQTPPGNVPPYMLSTRPEELTSNELAALKRGAKAFQRACAGCHGPHGEGGKNGSHPVGAINNPAFLGLISDQALRRFVITGRGDLGMPNYAEPFGRTKDFKPLTNQEVSDIVSVLSAWRRSGESSRVHKASEKAASPPPEMQ